MLKFVYESLRNTPVSKESSSATFVQAFRFKFLFSNSLLFLP